MNRGGEAMNLLSTIGVMDVSGSVLLLGGLGIVCALTVVWARAASSNRALRKQVQTLSSDTKVQNILGTVPVGIGMYRERQYLWVNRAMQAMTGHSE